MEEHATSWHSYPSIYALGHRYIEELLLDPVLVEEKIDGSQFSFGVFGGELRARSKGAIIIPDAPPKMFARAIAAVKERLDLGLLVDGWTYRGEVLDKPKHNTLSYSRVPKDNIILFDVNTGEENYLPYIDSLQVADHIGLEHVPKLYEGKVDSFELFKGLLERESCLGGTTVEGVVIKNYSRFGLDKKVLMGKFVSEAFKEANQKDFRLRNPAQSDIVQFLIDRYRTEARWQKAVQHLREKDELDLSPKDIGKLLTEAKQDILKECREEIQDALFKWACDKILRGATAGLPEWYKEELAKLQFEGMATPGN